MSQSHDELTVLIERPGDFVQHPDAALRRMAVALLAKYGDADAITPALDDADATVRAASVEALGTLGAEIALVMSLADDPDERVVEAVATALGELEDPEALEWLSDAARNHADKLVREAAVAALGAIGHPDGVPLLLELVGAGPPQVRRRCVVALTVFDGPEIEAALRSALDDRNPMVREAAEMVVGRPVEPAGVPLTLTLKPRT